MGLQDEYLRSDGSGREFLKIEAGGSILPASTDTLKTDNTLYIKKEKLFSSLLFLIWQMLQKKC